MTIEADGDRVGAWFDCHYADEAHLEPSEADEASTANAWLIGPRRAGKSNGGQK